MEFGYTVVVFTDGSDHPMVVFTDNAKARAYAAEHGGEWFDAFDGGATESAR